MNNLRPYRAWHKEKKVMMNVNRIDFVENQICGSYEYLVKSIIPAISSGLYGFDEVILMQSTGLRDKNGVEIFEGDALKWKDTKGPVFQDQFGTWKFGLPELNFYVGLCPEEVLIIGNIYEKMS